MQASNQNNASNLSHEVHRVGYHFPSTVVDKACNSLGITLSRSGQILQKRHSSPPVRQTPETQATKALRKAKTKRQANTNKAVFPRLNVSQATLDTDAKAAIKDLFPNIPDEDLYRIVRHAFEKVCSASFLYGSHYIRNTLLTVKGNTRVGTADLPLTRRATLAVVAHIRHNYTDYDHLLRLGSWAQARNAVEHMTLDKLVEWRADKDDNADAMSDILREVIVIDDDDDDDDDGRGRDIDRAGLKSQSHLQHRDSSVEIISSQARAENLQTQQISYRDLEDVDSEDLETPINSGLYVHEQQPQEVRQRLDRSDVHRRQAWEDARSRFRQGPAATRNPFVSQDHLGSSRSSGPCEQADLGKAVAATQVIDLTEDGSVPQVAQPKVTSPIVA